LLLEGKACAAVWLMNMRAKSDIRLVSGAELHSMVLLAAIASAWYVTTLIGRGGGGVTLTS
jgi:hypothetical protein